MSTFYRFFGLAIVLISFGLLVSALPSPRDDDTAWVIVGTDPLCELLKEFFVKARVCLDVIAECQDLVKLKADIAIFVALCNAHAAQLLKVGADVKVTAEAQASIVACYAAMITLLVKACLSLTVKFGLAVIIAICVEVDAALSLVLKNLDLCIKGVVVLIIQACGNAVVGGFAQLKFKLCAALFASLSV
ncbi:unnamed protein product [Rhizoctonia solani]|uniref:Transmembrane protein n=1 Tax=Rhizoctonia solani TaxID=456999 RepID=A0A8H2XZU2_9AGAM|nr:unnamed protein product [Rhizoctonia solani]